MDCQFGLKSFQDWLGSCAMGLAATGVSAEQPGDGRGGDGLPPVCGGGNAVCHESKNRHEQASRACDDHGESHADCELTSRLGNAGEAGVGEHDSVKQYAHVHDGSSGLGRH